jgi:hypothetical protein
MTTPCKTRQQRASAVATRMRFKKTAAANFGKYICKAEDVLQLFPKIGK